MSPGLRAVTLWLAIAAAAGGQDAPIVVLRSPVTAPEEFTRVVASRETADGRLLVADRRENRVVLVSFDGTPALQLGRVGAGPGEYRTAGALVAMPGDSTALADAANGRWLLFNGRNVGGFIPLDDGTTKLPEIPVGISPTHVYGYGFPEKGIGTGAADTIALVRFSRRTGARDTVTLLAAQTARRSPPREVGQVEIRRISLSPWTAGDQALLFDDGWLAIARVVPYSVDWISPNGQRHRGKPLRASDPPFTDAEKRAFLSRVAEGTGRAPEPITSRSDWPDVITAFTSASPILGAPAPALLAGPNGLLIIRRQPTAAEPEQRYDIVDRASTVVARIILGRRETLVGSARAHLYSVVTDDDGVQRIRRYDWALPGR